MAEYSVNDKELRLGVVGLDSPFSPLTLKPFSIAAYTKDVAGY